MAKGYGFEVSDWLLLGAVGAAAYFLWRSVVKPTGEITSGIAGATGAATDFFTNRVNEADSIIRGTEEWLSGLGSKEDTAYKFPPSPTDDSGRSTYWSPKTLPLSSPSLPTPYKVRRPTEAEISSALDWGRPFREPQSLTQFYFDKALNSSTPSENITLLNTPLYGGSSAKQATTQKVSMTPTTKTSFSYTKGSLDAGTYKVGRHTITVSKSYRKKKK